MRKLFLLILLIVAVFWTRPLWEDSVSPYVDVSFMDTVSDQAQEFWNGPIVDSAKDTVQDGWEFAVSTVMSLTEPESSSQPSIPAPSAEELDLTVPENEAFSFYNIQLGDDRAAVEEQTGEPQRSSLNEYNVQWHAYHDQYRGFLMVSYDENNQVNGLYSNQDVITSADGIALDSSKDEVRSLFGEPLEGLRKGFTLFQFNGDEEYDVFQRDGQYITVFYDIHENTTVTAVQVIAESLEDARSTMYAEPSTGIISGFEYQLFDLTNAARVQHGLPILEWDEQIRPTAQAHSQDMADNDYFSHTNLEGQSPFDRMDEDGIEYTAAGENLAYGQFSSIFAHEGLMNSLGHRENILNTDYTMLGVGVAFNAENQTFYTQKYRRL